MEPTLEKPALETPAEYGTEVMRASWNPLVATLAEPLEPPRRERVPEDAETDVEAFLAGFYRSQQG